MVLLRLEFTAATTGQKIHQTFVCVVKHELIHCTVHTLNFHCSLLDRSLASFCKFAPCAAGRKTTARPYCSYCNEEEASNISSKLLALLSEDELQDEQCLI